MISYELEDEAPRIQELRVDDHPEDGKPYSAGTSIIYNGDLRKASHAECGQQDRKRQQ